MASTRLTCSLVHTPVIAPTLHLDTVGSFGATGSSPRGLSPVQQIAPMPMRWFIRCQPDRRCSCIGSSGATGFCRTHPFQSFLSSFFVFCLAWPFCFIPGIYNCSLDKLISHIDCVVTQSPKPQNNGLMGPCSLQERSAVACGAWPSAAVGGLCNNVRPGKQA